MKARLAGLILLMGVSMAAQARSHTFALDDEIRDLRSAAIHFATDSYAYRPALLTSLAGFEHGYVMQVHNVRDADGDFDGCPGPIPEPGTYAMLLAGLGLMTTIARRKRMDR